MLDGSDYLPHVLHLPSGERRPLLSDQLPIVGSFVPSTFSVTGLRAPLTVKLGVVPVRPHMGQFAALQVTAVECATGLTGADVPLELLRSLAVEASLFTGYVMLTDKGKRARKGNLRDGFKVRLEAVGVGMATMTSDLHATYVVGWAGGKQQPDDARRVQAAHSAQHGAGLSREWRLQAVTRLALSVPYRYRLTAVQHGMGWKRDRARKWVQLAKSDPATREAWRQADKQTKGGKRT